MQPPASRAPSRKPAKDGLPALDVPEPLAGFLRDACGLSVGQFQALRPADLPVPASQLLAHERDMTSTLASYHGSALRVDILQTRRAGPHYFREVFLRTTAADRIVEYGVIAIALGHFKPEQQAAIEAGQVPLGGLLHQFKIPFVSSPIGFFSIATTQLAETRRVSFNGPTCHGRFNQLSTPDGEPLAWIMEILPPAHPSTKS